LIPISPRYAIVKSQAYSGSWARHSFLWTSRGGKGGFRKDSEGKINNAFYAYWGVQMSERAEEREHTIIPKKGKTSFPRSKFTLSHRKDGQRIALQPGPLSIPTMVKGNLNLVIREKGGGDRNKDSCQAPHKFSKGLTEIPARLCDAYRKTAYRSKKKTTRKYI